MRPSVRWLPAVALVPLLAGCPMTSIAVDAGLGGTVGSPCEFDSECRNPLRCEAASRTCQPVATIAAGAPCTYTGQCLDGLYCSAAGVCATAGAGARATTCANTSNCQRGLVCARTAASLFGTCEAPGGTPGGDAGTGRPSDVGGMCTGPLDCVAGLLCSSERQVCVTPSASTAGVWGGVTCDDRSDRTGPTAYFEVPDASGMPAKDFFRLPFPNNVRRDATTGRLNLTGFPHPGTALLGFDLVDRYARAAEQELDGFGTNVVAYFRFSASPTLDSGVWLSSIRIVDLENGAATPAISYTVNTGRTRYICENFATVTSPPGWPLRPGRTYATIITTQLTTGDSRAFQRDADFLAMLSATAPTDARLTRAYAAYAPLRTYLTRENIDPSTILNAAVFTTQHVAEPVQTLRAAVQSAPAPTAGDFVRCAAGVRSPCDDGIAASSPDHVRGCFGEDPNFDEYQGRIEVPYFQRGTRPYRAPGDGVIVRDASGAPMVQGTERVCVTLTIPRGATAPSEGWPVVLYQHGTGGSYRSVVTDGIAAAVSNVTVGSQAVRFATIGIEGAMHGDRRGMGITEHPNTLFFNFANPQAARDNVLQGAADVFSFVRAARTVRIANVPTMGQSTSFDPARVLYVGHSQGATVGLPAIPFEPDLAGSVMSGLGGDLRESLLTKTKPVDVAALAPVVLAEPDVSNTHPALNLFQSYIERADAVNFAPMVFFQRPMGVPLRPLVQTYGYDDTFSTERTMQAVVTAMGLPVARPLPNRPVVWPPAGGPVPLIDLPAVNNINASGMSTTGALLEVDPMGMYDGHFVLFRNDALRTRVASFLGSVAAGMPAVR